MNNIPLISIIIPVYNAEKFLSHCINSILEQSYINLEIILVNDGSTDNSLSICEYYALKDNRIKVFTQANKGVSSARNLGIEKAQGEWIYFVDSDDLVFDGLFRDFYETISLNKLIDVYKFGYIIDDNGRRIIMSNGNSELVSDHVSMLLNNEKCKYFGFLWNMIFKKSILKDVRFETEISWCEDHIFSYRLFLNSKLMYISEKAYYCYFKRNNNSLSVKLHDPYKIYYAAKIEKEVKFKYLIPGIYNKTLLDFMNNAYDNKLYLAIRNLYYSSNSYKQRKMFFCEIGKTFNIYIDLYYKLRYKLSNLKMLLK